MSESQPIPAETTSPVPTPRERLFYAPWMIGVLILFVICEVFFFAWGENAIFYATVGLFFAFIFNAFRCWRVIRIASSCFEVSIVLVILFVMALAMLLPAVQSAREAALRSACTNNLKQFGLAIYNYVNKYEQFPPPFVANEVEHPIHSWRTLLLPFLEMNTLYRRLDLQKPWDAPENQTFTKLSSDVFRCPSVSDSPERPANRTDYVAVTGDDTIWPTDGTTRTFKDVTVPSNNVVMLIEINHSAIPWAEPRDVKLEDLLSGKFSWRETGVHNSRGAFYYPIAGRNVLFSDGSVHYLYGDLTPDQIRRLFSINEPFDMEVELSRPEQCPIVFRHNVFYVWLATLVMQLCYIGFPIEKRRRRG